MGLKGSKSQKRLAKRQKWFDENVQPGGRCKPIPGCGTPTGIYHRPGSNKK